MNVRVFDYPTRLFVSSETDGGMEYVVDLCAYPRREGPSGTMLFNGACGHHGDLGCKDFVYRCEPQLKKPGNEGKFYRCKHIRIAREQVLDFILPVMCKADPNLKEEHQA